MKITVLDIRLYVILSCLIAQNSYNKTA